MFDPLRVALVAEGPTDGVVIEATLKAMLNERPFVLTQIFPEGSISFGELGGGWVGVYRWCHQSARRGNGRLQRDALIFQNYDLLVLHLDADVAGYKYEDGSITPASTDGVLPCELACPPASDTTSALRAVLLSWCGEAVIPERTLLCLPSKSTEAWVVAALFPNDKSLDQNIECYSNPETRLGQQPKAKRIRKKKRDYEIRAKELVTAWPRIANQDAIGEAHRFQTEFLAMIPAE